ncbi:MAG TPA: response regulator [Vicinamibacteria bacterium]|nr:response regulator [Vicinamibacteria bacterium]
MAAMPPLPVRRRRILVIDDYLDAAESLRDVLLLYGHAVAIAHSAAEGLLRARAFRPDVVVCELRLRHTAGWRLPAALRALPRLAATRVIALTVLARAEDVRRALAAGFDAFLTKPADPMHLLRLLGAPLLPLCG